MRKSAAALVIVATTALAVGVSTPAFATDASSQASCAGLAGASRSGDATAQAQVVSSVIGEAFSEGRSPGSTFSDFASYHQGTAEACLA